MPYEATVYNVFIASPGDVEQERAIAREVVCEWNSVHAETERIILLPIGWETHSYPDMGNRPQEIINRQILDKSDILVAIFWYRLGTATGVAESGTIEEIENHLRSGRPAMIYFSSRNVPRNIDTGQFEAILRAEKNYRDRGLIDTFENSEEFRLKFTRHLATRMVKYLKSHSSTTRPGVDWQKAPILEFQDFRGKAPVLKIQDLDLREEFTATKGEHFLLSFVIENVGNVVQESSFDHKNSVKVWFNGCNHRR
jgi:hypothetical protein